MNLTVFNQDLIPVYTTDKQEKVVIGRELHEALGIGQDYSTWFKRMCDYGDFEEGSDFSLNLGKSTGGRPKQDHFLTLDTAKEIAMLQNSPIGKAIRKKLIELEKHFHLMAANPSYLLDDLIARTERWLEEQKEKQALMIECAVQKQQIAEMQPKATYYDRVLSCKNAVKISVIAKDYGKSAQWLNKYLHEKGVQFKEGDIWFLYQDYADKGYTKTKSFPLKSKKDGESFAAVHTYWTQKGRLFIYDLLKADGILPILETED